MDNKMEEQFKNYQNQEESQSQIQVTKLTQILEESRKFTINFIYELKEKALAPISQDVLDYYHGQIEPFYHQKDILHIMDKRISKMIRNKKLKKNWNFEDIILLLWLVSKYMDLKENLTCETFEIQDWQYISKLIPGSSPKGCMFKFISLKKVKLSIFNWSQQEESILKSLVKRKYGINKWKQISQELYENNTISKIFRTPKQCRQHWNCYLDPKLKKGPWSEAQDIKLLKNVKENKGERKWSSIKHLFEGRTQNALKNRYNLLIERQKKLSPNKNQNELITEYLKGKSSTQTMTEPSSYSFVNDENILTSDKAKNLTQQLIEQSKFTNKKIANTILKNAQILVRSQNSSFKLSQAFEKRVGLRNVQCLIGNKCQDGQHFDGIALMNLASIGSIFTNQQGFYTSIIYKPN